MSYDLMVFKPDSAPKNRASFLDWCEAKAQLDEDFGYNNPEATAGGLWLWMTAMIEIFPALGKAETIDDNAQKRCAEYHVGSEMICVTFPWNFAEDAYFFGRKLAEKYKVGFFDVSADDGDIIFPARTMIVQ